MIYLILFYGTEIFSLLITQQKQSLSSFLHLYVFCFQAVPDDSTEESFPAKYRHLLLYFWADLLYREQATEFVLTTQ